MSSKYYKIITREDSSRIGILNLNNQFVTPLLIEPFMYQSNILDLGTIWTNSNYLFNKENKLNIFNDSNLKLIIIPRFQTTISYPIHKFINIQRKLYNIFLNNKIILNYPTAMLYKIDTNQYNNYNNSNFNIIENNKYNNKKEILLKMKTSVLSDVCILEGIGSLENNIYKFMNAIINIKKTIPYDMALYLPNIITPINISVLIYLGADIFDTLKISSDSLNSKFYTSNSVFDINQLKSLPCCCPICLNSSVDNIKKMTSEEKYKFLYNHNLNILK